MPWAKIIQLSPPILFGLALHPPLPPTAAQDDREAHYREYRSQWTFPSSSPTLAIWTNSSSEHPRAHLSHCCFLPKSRAHASEDVRVFVDKTENACRGLAFIAINECYWYASLIIDRESTHIVFRSYAR